MTVKVPCLADICIIPMGLSTPSVSNEIAKIQLLLANSHLKHTLHSAGTTIEGPWDEVMDLIGQMHEMLHYKEGVLRVQSDIRVGTRIDKSQTAQDKIEVVEKKMKEFQS